MRKLNCIHSSKPKGPEITHSAPGCLLAVLNWGSSILVSFVLIFFLLLLLCVFHCKPQYSNILKWLLHFFTVLPYVGFFIISCSSTEDPPFFIILEVVEVNLRRPGLVKFWVLIDQGFPKMMTARQSMLLSLHIKYCKKLEILRPQRK